VTDEMDRRTLVTLLDDFYSDKVTKYSTAAKVESKDLFSPYFEALKNDERGTLDSLLECINGLPDRESPELVGLHSNATFDLALLESDLIIKQVIISQRSSLTKALSQDGSRDDSDLSGSLRRL